MGTAARRNAAKRRKREAAEDEAEQRMPKGSEGKFLTADGEDVALRAAPPPKKKAKKEKGWKSVEMGMELLKEFEAEGGMFFEEAEDMDEMSIMYGDGHTEALNKKGGSDKLGKKSKQARRRERKLAEQRKQEEAMDPATLLEENERLKRQLRELKGEAAEEAPAKEEEKEEGVPVEELSAWVEFDLHPSLMAGLARQSFRQPTGVQARCLMPAIRQRKDIVGAAETGSGKTLAFGLPILHHILSQLDVDGGAAPSEPSAEPKADRRKGELRALAILPTRELAVQVQSHLNAVARDTPARTECVVGGMSVLKQKRLLGRQPYVVVGTPGRLWALLGLGQEESERCDWLRNSVKGLRHLVLDEADRLVESGHFKELDAILSFVYGALERQQQLQTFVFSATLTLDPRSDYQRRKDGEDDGGKVGQLMRRLKFREPRAVHLVDLTQDEAAVASCAPKGGKAAGTVPQGSSKGRLPEKLALQEAVCSDDKDKESMLTMWLLRRYRWNAQGSTIAAGVPGGLPVGSKPEEPAAGSTGGRVVLFVNAITSVLRLTSVLALLLESPSASKVLSKVRMSQGKGQGPPPIEVDVLGLHSRMRQKDRLKRMERFRSLQNAVLVCTDIAARGLDVPEVAAVVHYQVPRGAEVFIHRSGRTARAGRSGESVAFMGPADAAQWGRVYRAAGIAKEQIENVGPTANEINAAKEASRLAAELEGKVHKLAKQNTDRSWLRRTADEAELMVSDDEVDPDEGKASAPRHQLWGLYQQLQARVRRPPKRAGGGPMPRAGRRR